MNNYILSEFYSAIDRWEFMNTEYFDSVQTQSSSKVNNKTIIKFWWWFTWRSYCVSILISLIVGIILGLILYFIDINKILSNVIIFVLGILITMFVNYFFFKKILRKRLGNYYIKIDEVL